VESLRRGAQGHRHLHNADRMRAAFKPCRCKPEHGVKDLWGGPVQYVALTQVRISGVATLDRLFFTHWVFEWERECRPAILELGVRVPEHSILVDVV
jgi:hypothetical protein